MAGLPWANLKREAKAVALCFTSVKEAGVGVCILKKS